MTTADTKDRLIAQLVSQHLGLLRLSSVQAKGDRAFDRPESVAVTGVSMAVEFEAFYASVKELLALSRRLKEMWLFGPLVGEGGGGARGEAEERLGKDVRAVEGLVRGLEEGGFGEVVGEFGGTWGVLERGKGGTTAAAATGTAAAGGAGTAGATTGGAADGQTE